jgi:hypothetical protein
MFDPPVVALIESGDADVYKWKMTVPLTWTGTFQSQRIGITVDASPDTPFATDLASVPRTMTWLFPRYGAYTKAAIVHDYLCQTLSEAARSTRGLTAADAVRDRADADVVFRVLMAELGVPWMRRWLMWAAVTWATAATSLVPGRGSTPVRNWVGRVVAVGGGIASAIGAVAIGGLAGAGAGLAGIALGFLVGALVAMARPDHVTSYVGAWILTIAFCPLLAIGAALAIVLVMYLILEDAARGFPSVARLRQRLFDKDQKARLAFSPKFARMMAIRES